MKFKVCFSLIKFKRPREAILHLSLFYPCAGPQGWGRQKVGVGKVGGGGVEEGVDNRIMDFVTFSNGGNSS